ncbi:HAD family acid phosphatase [Amycolatopsis anabasis]|uniref:HAD family acid phosphatase n=1 Tax=Amycolatopsis anabasis TaxID=1840409 RepID=UPI00131D08E4|nr:HAD family acid phosphatase [Amycolatopsis anabasis]
MQRYAITFRVRPGTADKVKELLRDYDPPEWVTPEGAEAVRGLDGVRGLVQLVGRFAADPLAVNPVAAYEELLRANFLSAVVATKAGDPAGRFRVLGIFRWCSARNAVRRVRADAVRRARRYPLWRVEMSLKGVVVVVAAACAVSAGPAVAVAEELPSYAQWQADVERALDGATRYLDEHAHDPGKPAIVLDIDNTSLETEYNPGKANKPVLAVEKHAKDLGMRIIIVSARKVGGERESLAQLRRAGYAPDEICLRKSGEHKEDGKLRCRKQYAADGFTITANIGNRDTDFYGGYFDRAFRLPDYDGQLS